MIIKVSTWLFNWRFLCCVRAWRGSTKQSYNDVLPLVWRCVYVFDGFYQFLTNVQHLVWRVFIIVHDVSTCWRCVTTCVWRCLQLFWRCLPVCLTCFCCCWMTMFTIVVDDVYHLLTMVDHFLTMFINVFNDVYHVFDDVLQMLLTMVYHVFRICWPCSL
jgi:hypothetical protein